MRAAITAAFAFGFNAGAPPQKQAAVTFADVPTFDAAINALVSKKVVSRATVDAMDEKAKSRAFYVSRLAELEAVGRVKEYLVENLKDKTSFQNFVKNLDKDELLKKAGWEEDGGWYWETVYRANTMSAFNAGRAEAFEEYEPEYLEFIGIEDFRQTPVCAARSGIVKKRTDPFWKSNFPPLHFNCRSTVRPVYAEEAAAFGIKESADVSFPDAPAKGFGQYPINTPSKSIQEKNLESPRKFLGEKSQWDKVTDNLKKRYEKTQNTPVATDLVNELKKYPFFKSVPKELRDDFERDLLNVEVDQLKILVKYAKEMKVDFQHKISGAYYSLENQKIYFDLGKKDIRSLVSGFKTDVIAFLHESGHWLDDNISEYPIHIELSDLRKKLNKDALRYVNSFLPKKMKLKDFNGDTEAHRKAYGIIAEKILEKRFLRSEVSDLINGLSSGKIKAGFGHPDGYWDTIGSLESETIAGFFVARGSGGERLAEVRKAFPVAYKYFENYLRKKR